MWRWVGRSGEMMVIIKGMVWSLKLCLPQQPLLILEMLVLETINKAHLIQIKVTDIIVLLTHLPSFSNPLCPSWAEQAARHCSAVWAAVCVCMWVHTCAERERQGLENPLQVSDSGFFTLTIPFQCWFLQRGSRQPSQAYPGVSLVCQGCSPLREPRFQNTPPAPSVGGGGSWEVWPKEKKLTGNSLQVRRLRATMPPHHILVSSSITVKASSGTSARLD